MTAEEIAAEFKINPARLSIVKQIKKDYSVNFKQYLIGCFIEECIEVAHAASKMNRFTPEHSQRHDGWTNLKETSKEFSEMMAIRELLEEIGVDVVIDRDIIAAKKKRLFQFAEISKALGVLVDEPAPAGDAHDSSN